MIYALLDPNNRFIDRGASSLKDYPLQTYFHKRPRVTQLPVLNLPVKTTLIGE